VAHWGHFSKRLFLSIIRAGWDRNMRRFPASPSTQKEFIMNIQNVNVNDIEAGNRIRKDFGDLEALAADIDHIGDLAQHVDEHHAA
jgi:hypothetical protein